LLCPGQELEHRPPPLSRIAQTAKSNPRPTGATLEAITQVRCLAALAPAPPATEETVNSYPVPKVPSIATVPAGTWLYVTSALAVPGVRPAGIGDGAYGIVTADGGRRYSVVGFIVRDGRIAEIDIFADPARLRQRDLAGLDG
jgi:hypothetical protein